MALDVNEKREVSREEYVDRLSTELPERIRRALTSDFSLLTTANLQPGLDYDTVFISTICFRYQPDSRPNILEFDPNSNNDYRVLLTFHGPYLDSKTLHESNSANRPNLQMYILQRGSDIGRSYTFSQLPNKKDWVDYETSFIDFENVSEPIKESEAVIGKQETSSRIYRDIAYTMYQDRHSSNLLFFDLIREVLEKGQIDNDAMENLKKFFAEKKVPQSDQKQYQAIQDPAFITHTAPSMEAHLDSTLQIVSDAVKNPIPKF